MTKTGAAKGDEWETPPDFFEKLNAEFDFSLDCCASKENHKLPRYFTKEDNALERCWPGIVWMNPPYSRPLFTYFLKKAIYEVTEGAASIVVALIPASTDTKDWHNLIMPYADEVRFVKGRVSFVGAPGPPRFPSAVVVFRRVTLPTLRRAYQLLEGPFVSTMER
jgi:phage N-6-adenine-methyltransferase